MNEADFNKLPEAQRKAAQQRLIDQGLYNGKPDGRFGAGTATAFKLEAERAAAQEASARANAAQEREDARKAEELQLKRMELQNAGKQTDVSVAAQGADAMR